MRLVEHFIHWLLQLLGLRGPRVTHHVSGRVASRSSAAVGGLKVTVIDKSVAGETLLAGAETDADGAYSVGFSDAPLRCAGKDRPDVQTRVYSGDRLVGVSEVRYDAGAEERIDVLLPAEAAGALASEHETLTADLARHHSGPLAALEENEERRDLTYLAGKTGWDARAMALASLADQFGACAGQIEPALFYALFRAGIPANEAALYRTPPATVEAVWRQALAQNVIPAELGPRLEAAREQFERIATERLLDGPPPVGVSPLKALLAPTLDSKQQRAFSELQSKHREDPAKLWSSAKAAFGDSAVDRLRIDGKLAYLTLNNAPLIASLHEAVGAAGVTDTAQLVAAGFHRPQQWRSVIGADSVPHEIPGANAIEKQDRYAELLAAQLRLSHPTAVLAQMVKDGETPVAGARLRNRVHAFLSANQGRFEIGMQPIGQFVAGSAAAADAEVVREIARIQRVHQITPDDRAMNGLLREGLDSAAAAMRYDREEFVRVYGDAAGGAEAARAVHDKAQQVHMAVLNIAATYLTARSAGASLGPLLQAAPSTAAAAAGTPEATRATEAAESGDVIAYATLEKLFGEMDFCGCDHCRSVLSPAAYLVDLLLFLDRPANLDPAPVDPPRPYLNPQDVLLKRRPDIAHLALSCENTNVTLPYIDIVNETLEHYVVNGLSLDEYRGHDEDGRATSEELLSSPQFVADAAYAELADPGKAAFPPPLPFHQPLETLRRCFRRFDAPLAEVMAALRASDDDEVWRDIWMETVGLSRAEHGLLTQSVPAAGGGADPMATVRRLYGFTAATSDDDVRAALTNAKSFCRRTGISYEELAQLLRTEFVNPGAGLLARLRRLGLSLAELKQLKEGPVGDAELADMLAPGVDPEAFDDIRAALTDDDFYDRVMGLIVLTNPDDPEDVCNFDRVELRYADPDPKADGPSGADLVRLIRFIRLWRKLGWTLDQTDKAASALYRPAAAPGGALAALDSGFIALLASLGVVLRAAELLGLKLKRDLPALLACIAPIDMHGDSSLYRRMFVTRGRADPAFAEDGGGAFLTDKDARLLAHGETLRGAFALTGEEFDRIVADLKYDSDTPLELGTISEVFRRGWLARALKLSVRELLLIIEVTGFDPFGAPDPADAALLRLIVLVARLRALEVKPARILELVWNQDPAGKPRPGAAAVTALARTLRAVLAEVERDFAPADDPEGSIARARVALVYGSDAADFLFALLEERYESSVEYRHGKVELEAAIVTAAPPGRLGYDDFAKRLSYSGVLTESVRTALKAVTGVSAGFQKAVDDLFDSNKAAIDAFFHRFEPLRKPFDDYLTSSEPVEARRKALLAEVVEALRNRRLRQQALQTIAAAAACDVALASALLEDPAVLEAAAGAPSTALDDVVAIGRAGLEAHFFFAATIAAKPDLVRLAEADLDYGPGGASTLPAHPTAGSPISARWLGLVEAPEDGRYQIRIDTDPGAKVTLTLNGEAVAMVPTGDTWRNTDPIELRAGTLDAFMLAVENVKERVVVRWGTSARTVEAIPAARLYRAAAVENLDLVYSRLVKAAALAGALGLSASDLAHFGKAAEYHIAGRGWLNSLPVHGAPDAPTAAGLLKPLIALLDHAELKKALPIDGERLIEVLRDPEAAAAAPESLLFALTGWSDQELEELLDRFGKAKADLADPANLRRLRDGFAWARKLGIPVAALIAAATNEPTAGTVRNLQAALRARYDESSWLEVLKPINDEMRSLQRDALVASILHRMGASPKLRSIDTADKLFEYFLMDVQMAPCTLTSRIRLALSSVQLFIERCFMNLEPDVLPSSLNRAHWPWMKRYRLWEANRKVFLYPENWAEPELRDDQSPFFREAMSELLQGDITEDRAAEALIGYLTKLEEVAKLEICAVHHIENSAGIADDVEHVVGRTAGGKRKYFHRRRQGGSWTPWEKINLDIEDDPVLPVVWRGRLFLVWVKLLKETVAAETKEAPAGQHIADVDANTLLKRPGPTLTLKAVLQWSELVGGKWQPPRTSDPATPLVLGEKIPIAAAATVRSRLTLFAQFRGRALEIVASYAGGEFLPFPFFAGVLSSTLGMIVQPSFFARGSSFILHNPFSTPTLGSGQDPAQPRVLNTVGAELSVEYKDLAPAQTIITSSLGGRAVQPRHPTAGSGWDPPFYYEDRQHAFRVTTSEPVVRLAGWSRFGLFVDAQSARVVIPPLVTSIPPKFRLPGSVLDPDPVGPFAAGRDRIRATIATTDTIRFGDVQIGAAGGLIAAAGQR